MRRGRPRLDLPRYWWLYGEWAIGSVIAGLVYLHRRDLWLAWFFTIVGGFLCAAALTLYKHHVDNDRR